MAIDVRNTPDSLAYALAVASNQRMVDGISTSFHLDRTSTTSLTDGYRNPVVTRVSVSSANATDLATSLTLVNELKADVNTHFADAIAHNTAVSSAITTAAATDLTTAVALVNAIKAAYGTHLSASNVHYTNDSTNTVAAANATDQATVNALANELKGDVNAHMASAPVGHYINIVSA